MFNFGEDVMKQWSQNWEKMMGDSMEKMIHNEKFVSEMAKAVSATMNGRSMMKNAMDEQLSMMNMPSKTDIIKIMQKLTEIEERLIDLSEKYEDNVEETDEKINQLIKKIESMEKTAKTAKTVTKKPVAKKAVKKTAKKTSPEKTAKK